MPDIQTEGYEFFGMSDIEIKSMFIERIEYLMANHGWSRKMLADKSGLPTSSIYAKLDRDSTSELTLIDMCALAKAFDVSVVQLLPLTQQELNQGGKPLAKASMMRMWDVLLSRSQEELEVIFEIDQLLHARKKD